MAPKVTKLRILFCFLYFLPKDLSCISIKTDEVFSASRCLIWWFNQFEVQRQRPRLSFPPDRSPKLEACSVTTHQTRTHCLAGGQTKSHLYAVSCHLYAHLHSAHIVIRSHYAKQADMTALAVPGFADRVCRCVHVHPTPHPTPCTKGWERERHSNEANKRCSDRDHPQQLRIVKWLKSYIFTILLYVLACILLIMWW